MAIRRSLPHRQCRWTSRLHHNSRKPPSRVDWQPPPLCLRRQRLALTGRNLSPPQSTPSYATSSSLVQHPQ